MRKLHTIINESVNGFDTFVENIKKKERHTLQTISYFGVSKTIQFSVDIKSEIEIQTTKSGQCIINTLNDKFNLTFTKKDYINSNFDNTGFMLKLKDMSIYIVI